MADEVMVDTTTPMVSTSNEAMEVGDEEVPVFAPAKNSKTTSVDLKGQTRRE